MDKLGQKTGMEFTFLSNRYEYAETFYCCNGYRKIRTSVARRLRERGVNVWSVDHDPGCVEISTLPFQTLEQFHRFWGDIKPILDDYDLVPWKPGEMSGGGHIHVERDKGKWEHRLIGNMVRHLYNRPYLNWIFNDPQDTDQAAWFGPNFGWGNPKEDGHSGPTSHSYAMTVREKTVEFRFFDMPRTWSEARAMIVFADRYYGMHKKLAGKTVIKARTDLKSKRGPYGQIITSFTKEQCIEEFKELLKRLDLPYDDYAVFVERNLTARFKEPALLT